MTAIAVARNTFLQTLRQPIYGLIVLATLGGLALAPSITGWTLDDDNKLLRDLGLSTLLIQGLFLASFGASGVISQEIEDKTVLTVAAKPVHRSTFIVGKYLGVFAAVVAAHYLAMLALLLTIRHGVLQTAADKSDPTVLIAGPGVMLVVMISAGLLNYLFDWKFLSTTVVLGIIGLSISTFALLFIDRDFKFRTYEVSYDTDELPKSIDPDRDFKGIVKWRKISEPGEAAVRGTLSRDEWLGPVSDDDRRYLLSLSPDPNYRKWVDFVIVNSRKLVTPQMLKATVLLLGVLAIMTSFAVAVSTRLSTPWTLLLTLLLLAVGLLSDHYFGPVRPKATLAPGIAATQPLVADPWSTPRGFLYRAIPNVQFFWMIDAVADDRVIPTSYLLQCFAYAGLFSLGILAIGAALFETREVG